MTIPNGLTVTCQNGNLYFDGNYTNKEIYSSNSLWKNNFAFTLDAGDYTLKSSGVQSLGFDLRNYDTDTKYSTNFTLTETTKVYFGAYIYNKVFSNQQMLAQVNSGNTSLPYEPYGHKLPITSTGQTNNIYLGEVPTTRKIKKLVLTGEETWNKSSAYKGSFYSSIIRGMLSEEYLAYCSHLTFSALSQYAKGKFCFNGGTYKNCNLWFNQFDSSTTVEELKSYLASQYAAGTPVTLWYVLAEPETVIVNEPLRKIGDYADTISMEQAQVQIPTNRGLTTIDVATTLKPSQAYIKYRG